MFFGKKNNMREIKDVMDEPVEETHNIPEPVVKERDSGAPLFVKVDKYRDLIQGVQEIKLFTASTKQVFSVLHEIEALRAETLNVLRATLQRLERSIVEIDSELLRPYGASVSEVESSEAGHIESSLNELQKQLLELKRELSDMK